MAYLTKKEAINRGYITSVEIATGLIDGTYNLDDDIVKEHFSQVGVYDEVYNGPDDIVEDDPTTPDIDEHEEALEELQEQVVTEDVADEEAYIESVPETDDVDSNDIKFTIDGTEVIWSGSPSTRISTVYKKGISEAWTTLDLYDGLDKIDVKKTIASLKDKALTTTIGDE